MSFLSSFDFRTYLFLAIIIFYLISRIAIFYRDKFLFKDIKNLAKADTEAQILYIDRYYITKLWYTVSCVLIYFFANVFLIIYLRFNTFSKAESIQGVFPLESANIKIAVYDMFNIISYPVLFLFTVLFYKMMLNNLFFREVVKLHIFLSSTNMYCNFTHIFKGYYLHDFFGKLCLFFHNISQFRGLSDLAEIEDYHDFNVYDAIYENEKIQKISFFILKLARKYRILHLLSFVLRKFFFLLYKHSNLNDGFTSKIPYLLFLIILFYDVVQGKFYYIFYAIFPLYFFNLLHQYIKFLGSKNVVYDGILSRYFYKNALDYKKQRIIFIKDKHTYIDLMFESSENTSLYNYLSMSRIITYILLEFKNERSGENDISRNINRMYKRYIFLILYFIILVYFTSNYSKYFLIINGISFNTLLIYILWLIYFITFYYSINVFRYKKDPLDELANYIYSKKYNNFFLIFAIMQGYIFWLIVLKPFLFFVNTEIIFNFSYMITLPEEIVVLINNDAEINYNNNKIIFDIITIIRIYTMEEKINYLFQYFEISARKIDILHNKYPEIAKNSDALRHFLRQKNFEQIISRNMSLQDIQNYVDDIIEKYIYNILETEPKIEQKITVENKGVFYWLQKILGLKK